MIDTPCSKVCTVIHLCSHSKLYKSLVSLHYYQLIAEEDPQVETFCSLQLFIMLLNHTTLIMIKCFLTLIPFLSKLWFKWSLLSYSSRRSQTISSGTSLNRPGRRGSGRPAPSPISRSDDSLPDDDEDVWESPS